MGVILSQAQLNDKLRLWQKRLRLQDWEIQVRISRARDMELDGQAEIYYVLPKKMAVIRILDPVDYPPDCMVEQDMEESLVHELLHLHLAPIEPDDDSKYLEVEQAIESITSGLIALARDKSGRRSE